MTHEELEALAKRNAIVRWPSGCIEKLRYIQDRKHKGQFVLLAKPLLGEKEHPLRTKREYYDGVREIPLTVWVTIGECLPREMR